MQPLQQFHFLQEEDTIGFDPRTGGVSLYLVLAMSFDYFINSLLSRSSYGEKRVLTEKALESTIALFLEAI